MPDSDEEVDDETLAAFAGSEISGLSGLSQCSEGAISTGTTAARLTRSSSDAEIISQLVSEHGGLSAESDGEEAPQGRKRRRVGETGKVVSVPSASLQPDSTTESPGVVGLSDEVSDECLPAAVTIESAVVIESAISDAATAGEAAKLGAAAPAAGLVAITGEYEAEPSTPESPAVDAVRPAASGASDGRDSMAGAALAALAVDALTPQSDHTPLSGVQHMQRQDCSSLQLDGLLRNPSRFMLDAVPTSKPEPPATAAQNCAQGKGDVAASHAAKAVRLGEGECVSGAPAGQGTVEDSKMLQAESNPEEGPKAPSDVGNGFAVTPTFAGRRRYVELKVSHVSERGWKVLTDTYQSSGQAPVASKKPAVKPWK